jgi:hypothetical protein
MKRWHLFTTAVACLVLLAACGDNDPLGNDCCRLLTRVEITPDNAALAVGDSVQFSAVTYDEANATVETTITWQVATAARGTIAGTGWFKATSAGTTYVRSIVGALRDSALVTITAP